MHVGLSIGEVQGRGRRVAVEDRDSCRAHRNRPRAVLADTRYYPRNRRSCNACGAQRDVKCGIWAEIGKTNMDKTCIRTRRDVCVTGKKRPGTFSLEARETLLVFSPMHNQRKRKTCLDGAETNGMPSRFGRSRRRRTCFESVSPESVS